MDYDLRNADFSVNNVQTSFFTPCFLTQLGGLPSVGKTISGREAAGEPAVLIHSEGPENLPGAFAEGRGEDEEQRTTAQEGERLQSSQAEQRQTPASPDNVPVSGEEVELYYERVSLREFEFDAGSKIFYFPCPCGDLFEVSLQTLQEQLPERSESFLRSATPRESETEFVVRAYCPSCSLKVQAVYTAVMLREILREALAEA